MTPFFPTQFTHCDQGHLLRATNYDGLMKSLKMIISKVYIEEFKKK